MAWAKNGSTSLTSVGDIITVSNLSASKSNVILSHVMNNTLGSYFSNHAMRFNGDATAKYALRRGIGGTEYTSLSDNELEMVGGNMRNAHFVVSYLSNISGQEKLGISFSVEDDNSTDPNAGVAPSRQETAFRWENNSQITSVSVQNNGGYEGTTDWKVGSNISVLGSELTPSATSPETNSIFVETDTAKRWFFNGTNWNMQPSFQDDFSTDKGWVSQDTTNIKYDGVNKYFYFNLTRDNSNNASHYDLGAGNVSNTAWVLRGKLRYTTFTTGFHNNFYIGLSDKPSTTTQQGTGDFIGLCFRAESASHLFIANDSDNDVLSTQDGTTSVTWSNATDYYWEIKRTSATTYTVTVRTGSHSGTIHVTLNGTCASTTQDLRYIRFSDVADGAGGSGTTGYVDDLEFYNGVTSVQQ